MGQVARVVRDQRLADVREVAGGVGRGVREDAVGVREEGVSDQRAQQRSEAHEEMKSLQEVRHASGAGGYSPLCRAWL